MNMMGGMGGPTLSSMLDNKQHQQASNPLTISWVDSSWVPILNSQNVMVRINLHLRIKIKPPKQVLFYRIISQTEEIHSMI